MVRQAFDATGRRDGNRTDVRERVCRMSTQDEQAEEDSMSSNVDGGKDGGKDGSKDGGERGGSRASSGQIELEARPEQRLIRAGGCMRYVDFHVVVPRGSEADTPQHTDRAPLALALVLDRSGSMQGEKLATAKRAAQAVIDRLDKRDRVAVVIFDNQIETIQPAAAATDELKARVRSLLAEIEARATTALHEGWLTGCDAIAADDSARTAERIARCFLLTDGLANVGLTDPEQIAAQAAEVRERSGISTSTFGIGADYSEELLGPLAQAGGGSFHHLRTAGEIATTFVAELGQLLTVAAAQARLELEAEAGMSVEVISGYYAKAEASDGSRWSVALGDLVAGDEHHIVARVHFPQQDRREERGLRARVVWKERGAERATAWRELRFAYNTDAACDAEPRDPTVLRYAGQHLSDQSMREAIRLSKTGDLAGAQRLLETTASNVSDFASAAPELEEELRRVRSTSAAMAHAPLASRTAKELYYQSQTRSGGKKDQRGGDPSQPQNGGDSGAPGQQQ